MVDLFIDLVALFLFFLYRDIHIFFLFLFLLVSLCMRFAGFCLYSFAFTICSRLLSVRFFLFVFYSFWCLLSLVDLFFGLVAHFFLSFSFFYYY